MNKILIITITDYNNYGNQLQNYALQKIIEKLGCEVTTLENNFLDQATIKLIKQTQRFTIQRIIKGVFVRINNVIHTILRKTILKKQYKKELDIKAKRIKEGKKFAKKYIKKDIENQKYLESFFEKFDYTIIGSDQIWNPYFIKSFYIYFAQFAEKHKKISYAASIGVETIPESLKKIYDDNVNQIKNVSVREEQGKEILKNITKRKDIEVLVDPTMLLNEEQWVKIEKKPKHLKSKKYILNYFLGKMSKQRKEEIEKIAKENNCEIINILDKKNDFYASGPSEFLYLERNAFLVCTDSFHSCVFAILFNTPFIVFGREDQLVNMNSRIETLLSKFNLEDRYYKGEINQELLKADYTNAYTILEKEKEKSLDFLKNALNIEEN